nr:unnamed protein product [Callosobruchus chinensis]
MSKYREHATEQIEKTRVDFKALQPQKYRRIIQDQAEKIKEMAVVMNRAAEIDENRQMADKELVTMLKIENQVCAVFRTKFLVIHFVKKK